MKVIFRFVDETLTACHVHPLLKINPISYSNSHSALVLFKQVNEDLYFLIPPAIKPVKIYYFETHSVTAIRKL